MTTPTRHPLGEILKALFGSGCDITAYDFDWNQLPHPVRFGARKPVNAKALHPGFNWVIAQGECRVNNQRLSVKDILEAGLLQGEVTAIADVLFCPIPKGFVVETPVLQKQFLETIHKLNHADRQMVHIAGSPAFTGKVSPKADNSALACLEALLAYYNYPALTIKDQAFTTNRMETLAQKIETLGFTTQDRVLSWKEILDTDLPVIVQDEADQEKSGRFYFARRRKGNTLILDDDTRFIPENYAARQFRVLSIQPITRHDAGSLESPFTLGWYTKLFTRNWMTSGQMVLASVMVQFFAIGLPIFYMVIFDRVFGRQNLETLDVMAVGMVIILLTDFGVKQLRSYVLSHQLEAVDKLSVQAFLQQMVNLPLSFISRDKARAYTEKFGEITKTNEAITSMLLVSSLDVAFSVFIVIFLLLLHFQLGLIALASIVPIAVLSFWATPRMKRRAMENAKLQQQSKLKVAELLESAETVKATNANQLLKWDIARRVEDGFHRGFRARFDQASTGSAQQFIAMLGSLVTLYFGAHFVLAGEITFGVYIAINMLSRHVVGVVQKLFVSMAKFQEALGTLNEMHELFRAETTQEKTEGVRLPKVQGRVVFSDVHFRYEPETPWVLDHVNLTIEPGEKVVLTGQSGAGKTTLVRLLQHLYPAGNGFITLDGYNLNDYDVTNLRAHIGVALQKPALFAGTIGENIALGKPTASTQEILDAATLAGLDQFLLKAPQGLGTPVSPMASNLSGGQAACIALARVLLQNPSILILDEALSPLDQTMKSMVLGRIWEKYKNRTCLFITDYLPLHQQVDRILVLHEGRLVEEGTFTELTRQQGYYHLLHGQNVGVRTHA